MLRVTGVQSADSSNGTAVTPVHKGNHSEQRRPFRSTRAAPGPECDCIDEGFAYKGARFIVRDEFES